MKEFLKIRIFGFWNVFLFLALFLLKAFNVSFIATLPWIFVFAPIWVPVVLWIIGFMAVAICEYIANKDS